VKRKEKLETRNEADNAVYRTEKMLKDNRDNISEANPFSRLTSQPATTWRWFSNPALF
jgi:molecular chaperone DnaK (HSP70)